MIVQIQFLTHLLIGTHLPTEVYTYYGKSHQAEFQKLPSTGHTLSQSKKGSNSNSARQPTNVMHIVDHICRLKL
jgi:hypothetical protein